MKRMERLWEPPGSDGTPDTLVFIMVAGNGDGRLYRRLLCRVACVQPTQTLYNGSYLRRKGQIRFKTVRAQLVDLKLEMVQEAGRKKILPGVACARGPGILRLRLPPGCQVQW